MGRKRSPEELTCPEPGCGFVAQKLPGLLGHMQFKHNTRPTSSQPSPTEKQLKRFVTWEELDDVFDDISEGHDRWRS